MEDSTDVQSRVAEKRFKLTRVGVTGVKKPIVVKRPWGERTLNATLDIYVDLPSDQKGSHMSRNVEVSGELVDKTVREPVDGLENLAARMCELLLERHEYASYSEVDIRSDYFLERDVSGRKKSLENYQIRAKGEGYKDGEVKKFVGVTVTGWTTCPCAMEGVREKFEEKYDEISDQLKDMPVITHNQRNNTTLMIEVPSDREVEVNDLIDIVEGSLSAPTHEILKRDDEANIVIQAHENPKFVEDVVRDILSKILKNYDDFPDSTHVEVRSESEESIHKHNALAERVTTFGKLRE
ncbi:MAG: GTP cyclohydrolase I FolE2 [Candidatus Thermoplasmatota archaeon]|nr:GTP cyclohydrolase I FolE2 [Candidatus Thermoplasmatota archaeon]MBS3790159.1 GTP cyclohydrolase I FolE2 [Candidatus Thermoplasmatota archaeon]